MAGFLKFCQPPFTDNPVFDDAIVDWLIEIIKVFETKPLTNTAPLSEQFRIFVNRIL
jgi:hypothetical protein